MRSTPACLVQIVPPLPWVGVRVYACGAKMAQSGLLSSFSQEIDGSSAELIRHDRTYGRTRGSCR
jgi:hypothetical protein